MKFYQAAMLFLATGGPIGRIPVAPGTFGSLLGLLPCFLLSRLSLWFSLAMVIALAGLAVYAADIAEKQLGRKDPGSIVIDEIAGMTVTLAGVPFNTVSAVSGFIIFRVLDITKPYPIRVFERRLKGGLGVVMDDIVAGVMGNILLRLWLSLI